MRVQQRRDGQRDQFRECQPVSRRDAGLRHRRQFRRQRRIDPYNDIDRHALVDPNGHNNARRQRHDQRGKLDRQPLRNRQRLDHQSCFRNEDTAVRVLWGRFGLVDFYDDLFISRQCRRHVHHDNERSPVVRHRSGAIFFRPEPRHLDPRRHGHPDLLRKRRPDDLMGFRELR